MFPTISFPFVKALISVVLVLSGGFLVIYIGCKKDKLWAIVIGAVLAIIGWIIFILEVPKKL